MAVLSYSGGQALGRGEPVVDLKTAAEAESSDPLRGCLEILLQHYRRPASTPALLSGLPLAGTTLTPDLFVRAAARAGLSARVVRRSVADIPSILLPAVIIGRDGSAVVLLERLADGACAVAVPETGGGSAVASLAELERGHSGYAILVKPVYRRAEAGEAAAVRQDGHWFWNIVRPLRKDYALVALAAAAINLLALASPLFTMNVYDRVLPNAAFPTLWVLALGVFLAFSFDFLLRVLRDKLISLAGRRADVILSSRIFDHVLNLDLRHRPPSTGSFVNQLREFEVVREFFTSSTIAAVTDIFFVFIFVLVIVHIGGVLAVPAVAAGLLVVAIGLVLQAPMRRAVDASVADSMRRHSLLIESVGALETLKLCRAEGQMLRQWEQFVGHASRSSTLVRFISSLSLNSTAFLQQLVTVVMVVIGAYLFSIGEVSMGAIIAAVILAGRAVAPLSSVASTLARAHHARTAFRQLDAIMALPREEPWAQHYVSRRIENAEIEFKAVSFAYPGSEVPALQRLSLAIRPGERVAILGKIGSGKTTVGRLLAGLYAPSEGSILIDGVDVRQYSPAELRRAVALISQDAALFTGSVRDNITLGMADVSDEVMVRAATLAGVNAFVRRHPRGFDMPVGEGGRFLSTGQRQAVILARALLATPPILYLDEPSGSMDMQSERRLIEHLRGAIHPEQTLVLTTHRYATLSLVTRLVVLDEGRVVLDGPKDKVIESLSKAA